MALTQMNLDIELSDDGAYYLAVFGTPEAKGMIGAVMCETCDKDPALLERWKQLMEEVMTATLQNRGVTFITGRGDGDKVN